MLPSVTLESPLIDQVASDGGRGGGGGGGGGGDVGGSVNPVGVVFGGSTAGGGGGGGGGVGGVGRVWSGGGKIGVTMPPPEDDPAVGVRSVTSISCCAF